MCLIPLLSLILVSLIKGFNCTESLLYLLNAFTIASVIASILRCLKTSFGSVTKKSKLVFQLVEPVGYVKCKNWSPSSEEPIAALSVWVINKIKFCEKKIKKYEGHFVHSKVRLPNACAHRDGVGQNRTWCAHLPSSMIAQTGHSNAMQAKRDHCRLWRDQRPLVLPGSHLCQGADGQTDMSVRH